MEMELSNKVKHKAQEINNNLSKKFGERNVLINANEEKIKVTILLKRTCDFCEERKDREKVKNIGTKNADVSICEECEKSWR